MAFKMKDFSQIQNAHRFNFVCISGFEHNV